MRHRVAAEQLLEHLAVEGLEVGEALGARKLPADDVERPVAPDAAYYAELHRRAAELARSPDFKDAKSPAGSLLYLAEAESAFVEDKVAIRAKHSEEGKEGADSRLLMVREVGLRGTKVNLARRIKPDATAEGGESPPSPTSQKGALVTSGTCASAPPRSTEPEMGEHTSLSNADSPSG